MPPEPLVALGQGLYHWVLEPVESDRVALGGMRRPELAFERVGLEPVASGLLVQVQ